MATRARPQRLLQRVAKTRVATCFAAWREAAEFERSVRELEAVLAHCGDVLDKLPHERTPEEMAPVLALLQRLPLFAGLCASAQACVAAHARAIVLTGSVELPRDELDDMQLFSVLSGAVCLIHGSSSDPHLQQLLSNSAQQAADAAALGCDEAATRTHACSPGGGGGSSAEHGTWHRVRDAVSTAGRKRSMASSAGGMPSSAGGLARSKEEGDSVSPVPAAADTSVDVQRQQPLQGLSLGTAARWQSFCGSRFAAGGGGGTGGLSAADLPSSCLAAVAAPNSVAALLVLSRPAYCEALRLHHEACVARTVDLACRVPSLRHTPLKELTRLAPHMREATYAPGQVLLAQGSEASDLHFVLSGTVQLRYAASPPSAEPCAGRSQPLSHPPVVLGVRGAGEVLGDDAMREGCLAVTVVAVSAVTTLRASPQKLLACLDPLTLRLFGKLAAQQGQAEQLIQGALRSSSTDVEQQLHRSAVLQQLHGLGVSHPPQPAGPAQQQWRSPSRQAGTALQHHAAAGRCAGSLDAGGQLPHGLTAAMCKGLPRTVSVLQLVEVIRQAELQRMQSRSPSPAAAADAAQQSQAASCSAAARSGAADAHNSSAAAACPCHGALAPAAASSRGEHTELLETCGVAVLQVVVLQGQHAPLCTAAALAAVLDDAAGSWAAVAHDQGLQLVRWTATLWLLLTALEPGVDPAPQLEGLADALLAAAARLAGAAARAEVPLPVMALAAGLASGACFVRSQAGGFVTALSGGAYEAAAALAATAAADAADGTWWGTAPHGAVLLAADGVAGLLQSSGYKLQPVGGAYLLLAANPVLPQPAGAAAGGSACWSRQSAAVTLGPGRHTLLAAGLAGAAPGGRGASSGVASRRGAAAAGSAGSVQRRRLMRRRIEAMEDHLHASTDELPPPPEHLLAQPPPPAASVFAGGGRAAGVVGGRQAAVAPPTDSNGSNAAAERSGKARPRLTVLVADSATAEPSPAAAGGATPVSVSGVSRLAAAAPRTPKAVAAAAAAPASPPGAAPAAPPTPSGGRAGRQSLRATLWQEVQQLRASTCPPPSGSSSSNTAVPAAGLQLQAAGRTARSAGRPAGLKVTFQAPDGDAEDANGRAPAAVAAGGGGGGGGRRVAATPKPPTCAAGAHGGSSCCIPLLGGGGGRPTPAGGCSGQLESEPSMPECANSMSLCPAAPSTSNQQGGTTALSAAALRRHQQAAQQCEHALVMAACQGLGSVAAGEAYAASLPDALQFVNLSAAGLTRLPSLQHLHNLEGLAASFNRLGVLPPLHPACTEAAAAAAAAAADGDITSSDTAAAAAQTLSRQLAGGGTTWLPASLVTLGLSHCQLTELPLELPAALPRLTLLDASHNKLASIPATLGALCGLNVLLLGGNRLCNLPASISRLAALQSLHVDRNCLVVLPERLPQQLRALHCAHNQLQRLPVLPSGLHDLRLGHNQLAASAPAAPSRVLSVLLALSSLTRLDVSANSLSDQDLLLSADGSADGSAQQHEQQRPLPPLPALLVLDASANQLTRLPPWLPLGLQLLAAGHNRITHVPPGLAAAAPNLAGLDLQANLLTALPRELSRLSRLSLLCLAGNPGLNPEQAEEAGSSGMGWVCGWLGRRRGGGSVATLLD